MEYTFSKTFLINEDFKVVVSNWQLNSTIFLVNKTNKCAYLDIDKWTEFKKSIVSIDDEINKRFNCHEPNLNLIEGKTLIITGDLKAIISNWNANTTVFFVNNNGKNNFAFMDINIWKDFKERVKDIDSEFSKRFNYQYPVV
jgi:hypothetical protein